MQLPYLCHRHFNSHSNQHQILTIPKNQMPASQAIQNAQQSHAATKRQQQPRGLPSSSRPKGWTLKTTYLHIDQTGQFNPTPVTSATGRNHKLPLLQSPPCSNISSNQPSRSLFRSQLMPNSSSSRTTGPASNRSFSGSLLSNIYRSFSELSKNNQLFKKIPKTRNITPPYTKNE